MITTTYSLVEICKIRSGKRLPKGCDFSEAPTAYKYIRARDIKNGAIDGSDLVYISEEVQSKIKKYIVNTNDIVITIVGASVGDVAYVASEFDGMNLTENAVRLTEFAPYVNSKYLMYILNSSEYWELMQQIAGGAAQPKLGIYKIEAIKVHLPPKEVQDRIVDILCTYDDLIENNQRQIKLLEEAAQRLYKEWFADLRFPGHETTPITDGIPEGWTVQSMNDIAEYINGYAFKPTDWGTVGKPIIKIKEMGSGVTTDTPRNTGEDIPEKYNVTAGDILFSWSATLSAMIWDEEDGLLNQHLFKVIPGEGISREFVLQSILKTLDEFSNLTTGSTMKHIQRGKLKEVKVNVPPTELMEQYRNISEPIREQILNVKRQIILLRKARDRLLPKLMKGEIEV